MLSRQNTETRTQCLLASSINATALLLDVEAQVFQQNDLAGSKRTAGLHSEGVSQQISPLSGCQIHHEMRQRWQKNDRRETAPIFVIF
jgi:hypothetical protein